MQPLGDGALRFVRPEGVPARVLLARLRAWPRVTDAVVTETHACITFDPAAPPDDPTLTMATWTSDAAEATARLVTVKARYDGPDLKEVAAKAGLSPDRVAELHAAGEYTVAMVGFLPGFAYLHGADARLHVSRRAPRTRVPAGAIGLAAGYTGVYPFASPGGWSLVASAVDFEPFSPTEGARLRLGDRVRFERVG